MTDAKSRINLNRLARLRALAKLVAGGKTSLACSSAARPQAELEAASAFHPFVTIRGHDGCEANRASAGHA